MGLVQSTKLQLQIHILLFVFLYLSIKQIYSQQQQAPVVYQTKILIPNLAIDHYQYWLKNNPKAFKEFQQICNLVPNPLTDIKEVEFHKNLHSNLSIEDEFYLNNFHYGRNVLSQICSKIDIIGKSCWGYENSCHHIYVMPECTRRESNVNKDDEQSQKINWFNKVDFGFIINNRRNLSKFCIPDKYSNDSIKSNLECSKDFKTCRADNLMIKFNTNENLTKTTDNPEFIQEGTIGGWNCDLQSKRIQEENGDIGFFQSWFNQLKHYNLFYEKSNPFHKACDIYLEKQTFVLKLEPPTKQTNVIYNYFYDYLNLYATQHLYNRFSHDTNLVIWNDHSKRNNDFYLMSSIFSRNKPISIDQFNGKRVCFKKIIFSLLPKTVDGIIQNIPLVTNSSCQKSGLINAFNKHVLHRLRIRQNYDQIFHGLTRNKNIRITIISSSSSRESKIINEDELKLAIINNKPLNEYQINLIDYSKLSLLEQLSITQNTDILVGLHSYELMISLFLPDWAALIELTDCEDKCYKGLIKLRGIEYFSSSNDTLKISEKLPINDEKDFKSLLIEDKFNINKKLLSYKINLNNFMIILDKAIEMVKNNRSSFFRQDYEVKENAEEKVKRNVEGQFVKVINYSKPPKPHTEL